MAIFGDLDHLPFIDLTRVLAHQTGTLFLRTAFAGRSVELHLDRTELRGLYLDGFPINEPSRMQDVLHGLTTSATGTFEDQRRRLMGVSYRILGSVVDAEDVVQDAWLRWSATDVTTVKNPEAFLTTVVSRLSLDRLRQLARDGDPATRVEMSRLAEILGGPEAALGLLAD